MANIKNITKKLVDAGYSEEKLILMTEKEIRETYKNYKSSPKEDDSILSSPNTTPENNDNTTSVVKEETTMTANNTTNNVTINNNTNIKEETIMKTSVSMPYNGLTSFLLCHLGTPYLSRLPASFLHVIV